MHIPKFGPYTSKVGSQQTTSGDNGQKIEPPVGQVTGQRLIKQTFSRKDNKRKDEQKAALETEQAKWTEQFRQESLNAFGAALEAYGMCNSDGFRPDVTNDKLKVQALRAMEKLHSQGVISKDDLTHFMKFQASHQNFTSPKNSEFLPLGAKKSTLCQAAIGQAWIDAGLCNDEHDNCLVENAKLGFHIHMGTCNMWWE
jgi:hypothetical protein